MPTVSLPHNWTPRDYQLPAWRALDAGIKRAILIWHRRAGKDDVLLHRAAMAALQKPANYWHLLPEYEQARKSVWDAVNPHTGIRRVDEAFPVEIRKAVDSQRMKITLINGSVWQLVGSDNYNSLVGSPPYGVTASEWALSNPNVWAYLRPILKENGGWAAFISTPRGANHAKTMYDAHKADPDWYCETLTAADTGVFSEQDLQEELLEYIAEHGPEDGRALFRQEYYCDWSAALVGSYYGSLVADARENGRVCRVPYEPGYLVHTAWDLGRSDANPIWCFQVVGREIRIIDYITNSGVGPDWYVAELNKKGYVWGIDYCPHDIAVTDWSSSNGLSRAETLASLGRNVQRVPQTPQWEQVNAVRKILPKCVFDTASTEHGLNGLANYRREWDDKRKTFHDKAVHDWASHPSHAFFNVAWGAASMADAVLTKNVQPEPIKMRHKARA